MIAFELIIFLAATGNSHLDESALAQRIKNGDSKAFKTFFDKHYENLFRYLLSHNMEANIAEDHIQNAFLYIWNNREKIDPEKSLRAYLFRIGYTRLLNYFRDNKKFDRSEAVPRDETQITPEDHLRGKEINEAFHNALEAMPEKRREVFTLCFLEKLTYKEAASVMDITPKTVENHMSLAFKDMRTALKSYND